MIGAFIATLGLFTIAIAVPTYSNGTSSVDCSKTESIIASFPHPSNCSKYFQCSNGTKVEMTCPANQHYNSALRTCDDPKYAACKINASSSNPISMPPLLHVTVKPTDSNQTQLPILNPTPVYPRSTTVPGKLENVTLHATDNASVNSSNVLPSGTTFGPNLTSTPSEFTINKSGDVSTPASLNRSTNISSNASLGQVNQTTAAKSSEESTPSSATVKALGKVNVESGQDIRVKDNKNEEKNNSEEEKGDETESEDAESNDKSGKSATTTS